LYQAPGAFVESLAIASDSIELHSVFRDVVLASGGIAFAVSAFEFGVGDGCVKFMASISSWVKLVAISI
jgi:hypothetical protein